MRVDPPRGHERLSCIVEFYFLVQLIDCHHRYGMQMGIRVYIDVYKKVRYDLCSSKGLGTRQCVVRTSLMRLIPV
jgi:hypothetical protein